MLKQINLKALGLIIAICGIGIVMLYSAAGGNIDPWAFKQSIRFFVGMVILIVMATVDIQVYLRSAYFFYGVTFMLLMAVEILGFIGMGAQRWIDLYVIQLQPSELMKIALVMAMARYFHGLDVKDFKRPKALIVPLLMMVLPALLVMKQPDLGTAVVILMVGGCLLFMAGISLWFFGAALLGGCAMVPILWSFLYDYQKNRVLTFLDPSRDALASGYHITQSKIALGSGGFWGRGFGQGTQSRLNFLPEKQTDFIFTMYCEEFGFVGGIVLLSLYGALIVYGLSVALQAKYPFSRLVALGITFTLFLSMFINVAMVMGLLPVVGVPLPLVSYGGTSMLNLLMGFGILFAMDIHKNAKLPQKIIGVF